MLGDLLVDQNVGHFSPSTISSPFWFALNPTDKSHTFLYTETRKKRNLVVYEAINFGLYLRNPLSYKKYIFHYFHQFLKSFQLEKRFFQIGAHNQLILRNTLISQ